MALTATLYSFEIDLAHVDRGVYQPLAFRVARHPSESVEYLVTRVLAYALEYTAGIAFGRGLSTPEDPAIVVRDDTGALLAWIDVGLPDAPRLHRAAKLAPRVAVYTHKDPARLLKVVAGERIHRAAAMELFGVDRALVDGWAARLTRRMQLDLTCSDGQVYLGLGDETLSGPVARLTV